MCSIVSPKPKALNPACCADLTNLTTANLFSAVNRLSSFFPDLVISLLLALALIAFIDIVYQKYDYIKQLIKYNVI